MNNENEVMEKAPVLTRKDCVKGAIRWSLIATTTFNYDTQLAPAVISVLGLCCVKSTKTMTNMWKH